jgi:enoyl-CoA hydratase/carnithine racemase
MTTTPTAGLLSTRVQGPVAWVRVAGIADPGANGVAACETLSELVSALGDVPDARVVVLEGIGSRSDATAAHGNPVGSRGQGALEAYRQAVLSTLEALECLPKPTIAAIHGHLKGVECELALACDVVVADETTRLSIPAQWLGEMSSLRTPRQRSAARLAALKYLALTGEAMSAGEAQIVGLIDRVVPRGCHLAEAERLAELIAPRSSAALAATGVLAGASHPTESRKRKT